MPSQDLTGLSAVVKELYPQSSIEELLYGKCPLMGMMRKESDAEGEPIRIAMTYGPGGGRSADFTGALATVSGADHAAFQLTTSDDYAIFSITTKALRATKSNKGAFVRGLKSEIDAKMYNIRKSLCRTLYGDGSGRIGQVLSGTGTATLTLYPTTDMINFEVGDTLAAGAASDGSDATTNYVTITAIDRSAKTITAGANFHADFDDDDYLFHRGDAANVATGLAGFIDAGTSTLFQLNRAADPSRLSGTVHTASVAVDNTIEGALVNVSADLSSRGGSPSHVFMNPLDLAVFRRDISDKTTFEKKAVMSDGAPSATVSYKTLQLAHDGGVMDIIGDPYCPRSTAYMLDLSTWCIYSYGAVPGFLNDDGSGQILRESAADAVQGRIGCYWQPVTEAPGWNARINLANVAPVS